MAYIYAVRCNRTSKEYVGCTKNVAKRMREHRCLLRQGKHASASLQRDWNALGEKAFHIRVLQELPPDATVEMKRTYELWWMKLFERDGALYNENLTSFQGPPGSIEKAQAVAHRTPGNRWSPETNEKRRQTQLGRKHSHGWKISATKQAKRAMR